MICQLCVNLNALQKISILESSPWICRMRLGKTCRNSDTKNGRKVCSKAKNTSKFAIPHSFLARSSTADIGWFFDNAVEKILLKVLKSFFWKAKKFKNLLFLETFRQKLFFGHIEKLFDNVDKNFSLEVRKKKMKISFFYELFSPESCFSFDKAAEFLGSSSLNIRWKSNIFCFLFYIFFTSKCSPRHKEGIFVGLVETFFSESGRSHQFFCKFSPQK